MSTAIDSVELLRPPQATRTSVDGNDETNILEDHESLPFNDNEKRKDSNRLLLNGSPTMSPAASLPLPVQVLKDNYKDPLFLGHIFNLIFMIFYVLLDFSRSWDTANPTTVSAGFIILGIGYVWDSILYLQSWGDEWPTGIALYGELFNILGSCIYACSAVMYLYEGDAPDADSVFIIEALATLIFLVDAILYYMAWYAAEPIAPGKGCHYRDINLWGHVLNIIPAIIYVMSAINGLIIHFATRDSLIEDPVPSFINTTATIPSESFSSPSASASFFATDGWSYLYSLGEWKPERPASIVREMTKIYIYADLIWTIDAAILFAGWCIDTCVASEDEEDESNDPLLLKDSEDTTTNVVIPTDVFVGSGKINYVKLRNDEE